MKKIRKKIKTRVIPYALANNAYASIILPKLKRFKYDHDKIIKPKPNIYINIKSDEIIDGYYNLPNPIELNGSYQAALYKIDIENKKPINNYELTLTTFNLENDKYLFKSIKRGGDAKTNKDILVRITNASTKGLYGAYVQ